MRAIRRVLARALTLVRGHERATDDLRAELEAHLAMATDENIRRGMPPDEARRQALLASGGLTQAAERVREQRGLPWIESLAADTRFAIRHFRRTPLSTVTMVLVLSLGIGTNVVLFTVLNSIATMPPPGVSRDDGLVRIRGTGRPAGATELQTRSLSWPQVQEYAAHAELFDAVAAYTWEIGTLAVGDAVSAPTAVHLSYTTPNYFGLLGVRPVLGTTPAAGPDPTRLASSPSVMISHAMWQQQFGGASDVIGRTIRLNGFPVQVVGVAPPRFAGTEAGGGATPRMWVPLAAYPLLQQRGTALFLSHDSTFLRAVARLRPDVTADAATPAVAAIAARANRPGRDGARAAGMGAGATPVHDVTVGADVVPLLASNGRLESRGDLLVSAAAAGAFALLALLVTCTNVSALMVGLAAARRREIGVRLSLGAPRRRLVRQLLTESVLLTLAAAAIGLLVTAAGIRVLGTALGHVPLVVDWRVTAATCAVALVTGLLFGLSPALHATRMSVGDVLKSASNAVAARPSRLQRALVVAQVTLTQPLLVGLGVVIATMATDVGSRATSAAPDRIVEIELDPWAGNASPAEREARMAAVVERVAAMPGVVAALPMESGMVLAPLTVHPADRLPGITYAAAMDAHLMTAPEGYFDAFDIPVVRGRDFDAGERVAGADDPSPTSIEAVIIGRDLARRLWRDADPIGRRLAIAGSTGSDPTPMIVVGVVDERVAGPSDVRGRVRVFVPRGTMSTGVIARTSGPALPLLEPMRAAVAAEAPNMPIRRAWTLEQREAESRRNLLRASSAVAGGGLLVLFLSAIGLYAVVSFAVGQRTREIGIRTALGAQRGRVVRMFFAQGLALSAIGLLLGLPISMLVTRYVADSLNWPLTSSPLLGVAIGAVVLVVASVATWIPARRASTIDPTLAMRTE